MRVARPGCRALQAAHYGIGALTSVVILAELGDARRFSFLPRSGPLWRDGNAGIKLHLL